MNDINTHVPSYGGPQAASQDNSVAAMNNGGSVRKYRSEFVLLIIFVSLLPIITQVLKAKFQRTSGTKIY